jgi:hypothetical protein
MTFAIKAKASDPEAKIGWAILIGAFAVALGGAVDSHDIHRVVWLGKNFIAGHSVLHCEMPVTNTKLTHADVGMVREIEIK